MFEQLQRLDETRDKQQEFSKTFAVLVALGISSLFLVSLARAWFVAGDAFMSVLTGVSAGIFSFGFFKKAVDVARRRTDRTVPVLRLISPVAVCAWFAVAWSFWGADFAMHTVYATDTIELRMSGRLSEGADGIWIGARVFADNPCAVTEILFRKSRGAAGLVLYSSGGVRDAAYRLGMPPICEARTFVPLPSGIVRSEANFELTYEEKKGSQNTDGTFGSMSETKSVLIPSVSFQD